MFFFPVQIPALAYMLNLIPFGCMLNSCRNSMPCAISVPRIQIYFQLTCLIFNYLKRLRRLALNHP